MLSSASSFTSIPVIDLSWSSSPDSRQALLDQLRYAVTEVGFLYVSNHGVPDHVIQQLVDALPALFDLPDRVKSQIALSNSPHFLGYGQVGSETTAGEQDRREQFEFATELACSWKPNIPLYERLKGPNQVLISAESILRPTP
jgi:isopenicillin N synthase-like dioxygenase